MLEEFSEFCSVHNVAFNKGDHCGACSQDAKAKAKAKEQAAQLKEYGRVVADCIPLLNSIRDSRVSSKGTISAARHLLHRLEDGV